MNTNSYTAYLQSWTEGAEKQFDAFCQKQYSFVPFLLPELAVQLSASQTLELLSRRLGIELLQQVLQPSFTYPSPLEATTNSNWIKRSNVVGINVRTIHNFWNVVKYVLTVPESQQAIHLLPIWEPGVVESLYGMSSWNINPAFFSEDLARLHPQLDTVEKQLKVVINLLHAMGKVVGFDAIPHTDRYAEIVLANPAFFEWLRREDLEIDDHRANLHEEVQSCIWQWLQDKGSATEEYFLPDSEAALFGNNSEAARIKILFGVKEDQNGRNLRRGSLVDYLFQRGYEPVPATMAPPYRGLEVDIDASAKTEDSEGRVWRDYRISKPVEMSRVFGPLTRYKLYERLHDNKDWEIDFGSARKEVWAYVCKNFEALTEQYNFDFMRGDMSHVQMRPEGVPHQVDFYYDFHKALKAHIGQKRPYFGYFAETFMASPGSMAYGNEIDHLEQSDADVTLGDLQSLVVGSATFYQNFRRYLDVLYTRGFAPSFTIMTGDKDDPRFDKFYLKGNEARLFIALFLTDMPSYMGLGFEVRDPHPEPVANEYYTKLYVFQIENGPKATKGPYLWGQNAALFERLTQIRLKAEEILRSLQSTSSQWLLYPDSTGGHPLIAWTQKEQPQYVFVVNLDTQKNLENQKIPAIPMLNHQQLRFNFSTHGNADSRQESLPFNGKNHQLDKIGAGEGIIFILE